METTAPEVRQCRIEGHPQFGSSATAGAGQMAGRWLIADGGQGGHWADDAEVAGWSVAQFKDGE